MRHGFWSLAMLAMIAPGAVASSARAAPASARVVDVEAIPVTTASLGEFPFLDLPGDFHAGEVHDRRLEQKYVFPGGRLRTVEGRYNHRRIYRADGTDWNQTLLLRAFDDKVRALGGEQVYDGGTPKAVSDAIGKNEPAYARDLYNPLPYRYRQYVIRAPQGRIWIEIGYGYNSEEADLTIMQEG